MWLRKTCASGVFKAIQYDDETRLLRVLGVDFLIMEFAMVPVEIYHAFPTGETAACYYVQKVRGRYPYKTLPPEQWSGEPLFWDQWPKQRTIQHWTYNALTAQLVVCEPFKGQTRCWQGVPLYLIEKWPEGAGLGKYYADKIMDLYEATIIECPVCRYGVPELLQLQKRNGKCERVAPMT